MLDSKNVSDGAYKLWVYLGKLKRRYGRCVPSNRAMRLHVRVCERTIQRWKRELEAKGWLRQERRQRPHHREQTSCYAVRDVRTKCRPMQVSPPNVTPSVPLRGTLCSSEREESSRVSEIAAAVPPEGKNRPTKTEIEEVRRDWGKRPIDEAAIRRILLALAMRKCPYANFRLEAARRVREIRPANRIGFVIRLAESDQFCHKPTTQFDVREVRPANRIGFVIRWAGTLAVWQRMESGRLKVFPSLSR
jgi:hypothetical protein